MVTSTAYYTRPGCSLAGDPLAPPNQSGGPFGPTVGNFAPNPSITPGTKLAVPPAAFTNARAAFLDFVRRETRFGADGQPLGSLWSAEAQAEYSENGSAVLDALAIIVGHNGLDRLESNDARITTVATGMASSANPGPIKSRIDANAIDPNVLSDRIDAAKALLALLIDVAT